MNKKRIETSDSSEAKQPLTNNIPCSPFVQKAMRQYDTKRAAEKFASRVIGTPTDRREKRFVMRALALANVPRGASVLDLPCGVGRLLPLLKQLGYKVTGADVSVHMLTQARRYAGPLGENCLDETDNLQVANIFRTGFDDNSFDAVVCHRLLHYFPEPEVRQQALRELRRICSGPIVVSFLCNLALDAAASYVRDTILCRQARGCIPISYRTFAEDARKAGLVVGKWIPMRPLISKRWYAVLRPDTTRHNRTTNVTACNTTLWHKLGGKLGRVAAIAAVILIGFFISPRIRTILDPHECKVEQIAKEYQDGNDKFYVSANPYLEDLHTNKSLSVIGDLTSVLEKIVSDRSQLKDSFFLISHKDLAKIRKTTVWGKLSFVRTVDVRGQHFVLLSTERSNTSIKPRSQQLQFSNLRETMVCILAKKTQATNGRLIPTPSA